MTGQRTLVAVSAAQLTAGVAGLCVALRRGRHYDLPLLHGSPAHVVRDAAWMGTAYSAPAPMLAAQLWATARLAAGPDERGRRVLGLLGALMVPGYLVERFVRAHLRHSGWDPVETPVAAAGLGLAAAMVVLSRGWDGGDAGMATP